MDDKTRFDQLEEIIVELLRKQDRTIEEVGRLREALAAQQLLLSRIQNDLNRVEVESATTRRLVTNALRLLNKGFDELATAQRRNERLLQETATILATNALFQAETRRALAASSVFQEETKQALAENKVFQEETRTTLIKILDLLTKP